ncbi:hypothetical protein [Luteibacter sp. dw_328]|uniref:hypothetical protein n=1 Tax=Luteibacter sp. dw_328 TaxID=2719796 RepID=UPI002103859F|nr:hypothetical protein [Luteibacter sp. dw_328]
MTFRFVAGLRSRPWFWLLAALLGTAAAYAPGISGSFLFDDFPNIVDNEGVHVTTWSVPALLNAALSSPSSEFKRPLASLSFAMNYLISGADPAAMKATNIVIHLLNGIAAFALLRLLSAGATREPRRRDEALAAMAAALWLVMPINVTAVLYVVQRMESLANLFVLLALLGYVAGRRDMLLRGRSIAVAATSIVLGSAFGLLCKETAILTPLYAAIIEVIVFRGQGHARQDGSVRTSRSVITFFLLVLVLPFIAGSIMVVPSLFTHATWAPRSFTMPERLLSECRIVVDYIAWTLLPTPPNLSFYHDDFIVSTGWLQPWTTLVSALALAALAMTAWLLRKRKPLVALGIALFFACHTLTATIIPLELIYEHRNYFSSLGLALALVTLARADDATGIQSPRRRATILGLAVLGAYYLGMTAFTATRWANPLSLAQELAIRAPDSPRAQYELGRTYVIASGYRPTSPFVQPAYAALEKAAALPRSSTLAEQALIFFAAKLHQPIKDAWWASMEAKLRTGPVSIEDESAIMSLATCALQQGCDLPFNKLLDVYQAALSHPAPHSRLLAAYADFAWSGLDDHTLGYAMIRLATEKEPAEPAYHVTTLRFALAMGDRKVADDQMARLRSLNVGGRLDATIAPLQKQIEAARAASAASSPASTR